MRESITAWMVIKMPILMFWNLKRATNMEILSHAISENDAEIIVLAEARNLIIEEIISELEKIGQVIQEFSINSMSLRILTTLPTKLIRNMRENGRWTISLVSPPVGDSFLLASIHLSSKLYAKLEDQYAEIRRLREDIEEVERECGTNRTAIIGDFNLNPFEIPMIAADGLHAVIDRKIALKQSRVVQETDYKYFYNPMWGMFGDRSPGPIGTYRFQASRMADYHWNIFDQILVRPDLINYLHDVRILDRIGPFSLLKNDRINKKYSDHLPIVANLATERA